MDEANEAKIMNNPCGASGSPSHYDGSSAATTMTIYVGGETAQKAQPISNHEALRLYRERVENNMVQFEFHC